MKLTHGLTEQKTGTSMGIQGPTHGSAPRIWWLLLPGALAYWWVSANGYAGLNGQDAHDYLRLAKAWFAAFWQGGPIPLVAEHPHGYPMAGALGGAILGPALALRIVSLLSYFTIIGLVHRILSDRVKNTTGITAYVLLAVALSPFMLRYALTCMSDTMAIACLVAALWFTLAYQKDRDRWMLLGAFATLVLALWVRLAAAPVVMLLVLSLIETGLRKQLTWSRLLQLVGVLSVAALVAMVGLEGSAMLADTPLADWSPLNWFRRELHSDDGVLRYRFPNLVYALFSLIHPGQFPIGLLLLPFLRRSDLRDEPGRTAAIVLLGYLLFVAGMPFQNDRVLLLGQPFTVLLFQPAFLRAMAFAARSNVRPAILFMVLVVAQAALFVRTMLPFTHQAEVEKELASVVHSLDPKVIYSHGMGAALTTYCAPTPVIELWYAPLDTFLSGGILVVHPLNLEQQWKGRAPSINWYRAQAHGLDKLAERPDGWVIARLR